MLVRALLCHIPAQSPRARRRTVHLDLQPSRQGRAVVHSVDPVADNVEVQAGHLRLVSSTTVLRIIAETLAPAAVAV
jgi:hypothetical protein